MDLRARLANVFGEQPTKTLLTLLPAPTEGGFATNGRIDQLELAPAARFDKVDAQFDALETLIKNQFAEFSKELAAMRAENSKDLASRRPTSRVTWPFTGRASERHLPLGYGCNHSQPPFVRVPNDRSVHVSQWNCPGRYHFSGLRILDPLVHCANLPGIREKSDNERSAVRRNPPCFETAGRHRQVARIALEPGHLLGLL